MGAAKASMWPKYQKSPPTSWVPLCYSELTHVMGEPYVVTGNRMRYKDGPAELVDYLFDFDDSKERGPWQKLAYRRLYEGTVRLAEEVLDREWAKEWASVFKSLALYACLCTSKCARLAAKIKRGPPVHLPVQMQLLGLRSAAYKSTGFAHASMAAARESPLQPVPQALAHLVHLNAEFGVLVCLGAGCRKAVSARGFVKHLRHYYSEQLLVRKQVQEYV